MELKSGTIHAFEDGIVKSGHFTGSAYKTIILTTGNKLTCFDLDFITGIEIGKEYTFPVEQKGSYTNIVGTVTPVIQTGAESPNAEASGYVATTPNPSDPAPESPDTRTVIPYAEMERKPFPKGIPSFQAGKDEAIRKAVALKAAVEYATNMFATPVKPATPEEIIALAKVFEEYLK